MNWTKKQLKLFRYQPYKLMEFIKWQLDMLNMFDEVKFESKDEDEKRNEERLNRTHDILILSNDRVQGGVNVWVLYSRFFGVLFERLYHVLRQGHKVNATELYQYFNDFLNNEDQNKPQTTTYAGRGASFQTVLKYESDTDLIDAINGVKYFKNGGADKDVLNEYVQALELELEKRGLLTA